MKFENIEAIAKVIKDNPAKDLLSNERIAAARTRRFVTGEGLLEDMDKYELFEPTMFNVIKKKIAKTTRDLVERVLQPVSKVYGAKGGVRVYNLGEKKDEQFDAKLSDVRRGMSMKEWVQRVAHKAADVDPMSLIFTEVDREGNAYPTYKGTDSIYDYALSGRQPEYVIFELTPDEVKMLVANERIAEPGKEEKVYRVVDDAKDWLVKKKGEEVIELSSAKHPFKKVPGIIASDIPVYDSIRYESRLAPIIELIAEYFDDDSSKALFKKRQMYPREWSIELTCPKCEGQKQLEGEDCPACDGTGILTHLKPAQRISISLTEDGKTQAPTPPGGFYYLPTEVLTLICQELDNTEDKISATFWGTNKVRKTQGPNTNNTEIQTATGEVMNERTKEPKLKEITKWAESIDKHQTDNIKRKYFGQNAPESTIKYGDRYMTGTIEEVTAYYEDLKTKGAPISMLDRALADVYEASFDTNPAELRKHTILMKVEPFVHASTSDVLGWAVSQEIKDAKVYFGEWLATMNVIKILSLQEEGCRQSLKEYVKTNVIPAPAEEEVKKVA